MSSRPDTHILLRAFADELARLDVAGVCTSPGSRSSPILLALVAQPGLTTWSHIDERAAGFFAVGAARSTGRAAVVTCTSGTAAAEYLPAVIEAHEAGVPLLVITADRPPELRDVGAGQAIDQTKLYGSAARWFVDVGSHEHTPASERWIRTLAARAVAVATGALGGRPGPVHLNWPLREPLVPPVDLGEPVGGRGDGAPWLRVQRDPACSAVSTTVVADALARAERGVIVAGDGGVPGFGPAVSALAERLGWPLLADPLSGARHATTSADSYDAVLRVATWADGTQPDVVLRVGQLPTSKPLRAWLAACTAATQLAVAGPGPWPDPDGVLDTIVAADDPTATLAAITAAVEPDTAGAGARAAWMDHWAAADRAAQAAIDTVLGDGLSEPAVARRLLADAPGDALVVIASSMPVRDLETFGAVPPGRPAPRVLANRGANGIDGTLATAAGAAQSHDGPTIVLIGDVAFHYDVSALLSAQRLGIGMTIVVINNDGGGIFDFLPLATIDPAPFAEHVTTTPPASIAAAAALYGAEHQVVERVDALGDALRQADTETLQVIEVRTERAANVALHRAVWAGVAEALAAFESAAE